jgi:hypothetical protein
LAVLTKPIGAGLKVRFGVALESLGSGLLDLEIRVFQVFFDVAEELGQFFLVEVEASLAERVDDLANSCAHNLASFSLVESLLFNVDHEGFDFAAQIRPGWQAVLKNVLLADLVVESSESLLVISLLFDQVPLLKRNHLEGFLKDLAAVSHRVA